MTNKRNLGLCVLTALAGLTLTACGPSIDYAAKASIDGRVAALQSTAGSPVPPPTTYEPLPLAPGQWSQYKMTDDKGEPGFLTYKILGQEGGAYWIEILNERYTGTMAQKMLISFGSRIDPSQLDIRAVVTRDRRGNVTEMPPAMLPLLKSTLNGILATMVINWQGMPQAPTTVPAGRFDGCFKSLTTATWGPWHSTANSWAHPLVPLSGIVRTQGIDHPFTMELVAFGMSGATPDF
jgi:hypothetical protein